MEGKGEWRGRWRGEWGGVGGKGGRGKEVGDGQKNRGVKKGGGG